MKQLNENYWTNRYENQLTGWDIGSASPPLMKYAEQTNKSTKILIPGAGNGHEAIALCRLGYTDITVVDIAKLPLQKIEATKLPITCIHSDFFEIEGSFDLILEQTFFCALDPSLRNDYVDKMYELLADQGTLAGVLFGIEFEKEGPPFGGNIDEYQQLFSASFPFFDISPCYNSIPPRAGTELFFIAKKIKN